VAEVVEAEPWCVGPVHACGFGGGSECSAADVLGAQRRACGGGEHVVNVVVLRLSTQRTGCPGKNRTCARGLGNRCSSAELRGARPTKYRAVQFSRLAEAPVRLV
jgi:hypothetical protein